MKKFVLIFLWTFCGGGIAFAQYVAQTIQDRIKNDQTAITLDQADMAAKQADIDSIVGDAQADQVTAQVPDVVAIQSAQGVSAQPLTNAVITQ